MSFSSSENTVNMMTLLRSSSCRVMDRLLLNAVRAGQIYVSVSVCSYFGGSLRQLIAVSVGRDLFFFFFFAPSLSGASIPLYF